MSTERFFYLEDFIVGQKFTAGPLSVTAGEIIDFAKRYDPQEFHTDPEKAQTSVFGGHVASGWHTAALTMRLIIEATPKMKGGMVGRQVEKLGWPRPVRPGDALSLELEILDIRTTSNPARGIIRTRNTTFNQNKEPVQEMETVIFVPRRGS